MLVPRTRPTSRVESIPFSDVVHRLLCSGARTLEVYFVILWPEQRLANGAMPLVRGRVQRSGGCW